ncbi:MAG: DNA translocase FtsK [Lachnospiraceae bacterium]|nr:DNA translocase FtsK [Lachnospiraceae bacterium]
MYHEIIVLVSLVIAIFLFLCNFGLVGVAGDFLSDIGFGLFGVGAYVAPIFAFLLISFKIANTGAKQVKKYIVSFVILFFCFLIICEMIGGKTPDLDRFNGAEIFEFCKNLKRGGGLLGGLIFYPLNKLVSIAGTILLLLLTVIICFIMLTGISLIDGIRDGGEYIHEKSIENQKLKKEYLDVKRVKDEERRAIREAKKDEKLLTMAQKPKAKGFYNVIMTQGETKRRDDMHEITVTDTLKEKETQVKPAIDEPVETNDIRIHSMAVSESDNISPRAEIKEEPVPTVITGPRVMRPGRSGDIKQVSSRPVPEVKDTVPTKETAVSSRTVIREPANNEALDSELVINTPSNTKKKYSFPPISYLKKMGAGVMDSPQSLKETAKRLEDTLRTFNVNARVTDISQGPSVTRYELAPEQGVKVSRIVNLSDDIKLNLAATDIRIEAPIPGKSAVGIEVPNKENSPVSLRELIESKAFKEKDTKLIFAVGKDIAGKAVVADIGKMPHVLIAGATGSGKSVCINTIIMSILYKSHPDDVKMIMIDPKVVELSIYNDIPHLLTPVVTDPKKASAALHWGVTEMENRYRLFADLHVRDLKSYNEKVEEMKKEGANNVPMKLPQILIIVDELADLMMVSPKEVEESICRLAQLARACGIHLVIATQRPSVDVITGLIKANMPSRIAFAVTSGVDSRTILDMVGAEKLLGKGDMLFYPQGYSKPVRVQGAFVSDKEVADVCDFLKNQEYGNDYSESVEIKFDENQSTSAGGDASADRANEIDELFKEAGYLIIDKDKASIGFLQRAFRIGFNRAARIMDQLADASVVGPEEGTKPRKVLMSKEQFDEYLAG